MPLHEKTILLVEDDVIIATSEKMFLERMGYIVFHSLDGEGAIEMVREKNLDIHLILMDVDLGMGMDGIVAATLILKESDIPIIFLSSHAEEEIIKRVNLITPYGFIKKDLEIIDLDLMIKKALKMYEVNRVVE